MRIREVLDLLSESGVTPVVLSPDCGSSLVVVAPELVGRVLCVGFDGIDGDTDSYLLPDVIRGGASPAGRGGVWNNYGGEERVWFAPEGGPFALFFPPGEPQSMDTYTVPEPLNSGQYEITARDERGAWVNLKARFPLTNIVGTRFDIDVERTVAPLNWCPFVMGCDDDVSYVGFESRTVVRNAGAVAWTRESGAPGVWTLGQFCARPHSIAIMPFREGPGAPVSTEDFRLLNPGGADALRSYWRVEERSVLMKVSGGAQTKLEMPHRRTCGCLGAIDLDAERLVLVEFGSYPALPYSAGYALPYTGDPYGGSALSVFVLSRDASIPAFFELECCSPALFLRPNQRYAHITRTSRLRGRREVLMEICERVLQIGRDRLEALDALTP